MRDCPHQRKRTEPARSDSFSYNGRNELTGAALGAAPYGYSYDNIGNRKTAQEPAGELAYSPYGQAASTGNIGRLMERPALVISGPGSNLRKYNIPPFSRTDFQEEQ